MNDISAIVSMIIRCLRIKGKTDIAAILNKAVTYDLQFQYHDNWNGGIDYHVLTFYFEFDEFISLGDKKEEYASIAYEALTEFYHEEQDVIQGIKFEAQIAHYLNWSNVSENITKDHILNSLNIEVEMLISVGTGEIIIKGTDADAKYKELHMQNSSWLKQLGVNLSQSFSSLWEWFNYYSRSLGSYQDRRVYIHSVYDPLFVSNTVKRYVEIVDAMINKHYGESYQQENSKHVQSYRELMLPEQQEKRKHIMFKSRLGYLFPDRFQHRLSVLGRPRYPRWESV